MFEHPGADPSRACAQLRMSSPSPRRRHRPLGVTPMAGAEARAHKRVSTTLGLSLEAASGVDSPAVLPKAGRIAFDPHPASQPRHADAGEQVIPVPPQGRRAHVSKPRLGFGVAQGRLDLIAPGTTARVVEQGQRSRRSAHPRRLGRCKPGANSCEAQPIHASRSPESP